MLTIYLLISVKPTTGNLKKSNWSIYKWSILFLGVGMNGVIFLGMHYLHYRDLEIIGYIKNILGLHFYHQDVEYFALSFVVTVSISFFLGIFLRALLMGRQNIWSFEKTQECILLCCGFIVFGVLFCGMNAKDYFQSKIFLYEIAGNNHSTILNDELQNCDYVEVINLGVLPCQIEDLYLSDDKYNLEKISLSGMVLQGKDIQLIPCKEGQNSFAINRKGETIYLSDGNGRVLDFVVVNEIEEDQAYFKTEKEFEKWEIGPATPWSRNESQNMENVKTPVLSHESGFYQEAFHLELSGEDTTIYYTLDGSTPDEGSYLYEEPIWVYDKSEEDNVWRSVQNVVLDWQDYIPNNRSVTKAFIVRALAVDNNGNKSDIVTATYFIDCERYKDRNVISLVADPDDLFGNTLGIYVTGNAYDEWYLNGQEGDAPTPLFKMSGMESERQAVFELFCNLESVMQQDVGIRIQGASAREKKDKRFSVYARDMYSGSNRLELPVFERETDPHSVVLREFLSDVICQDLMDDRGIPIQRGVDIRLFLNGEHWYDRYLREKYSCQYFEDYYGIDKEQLVLYKSGTLDEGVETDALLYDELYRFVTEEDFTDEQIYEEFCEMVDISNYIDYMAANIYCANMDVDDIKNVVIWRSREKSDTLFADGKWRFALYDMDAVEWIDYDYYGISETAEVNSFSQKPQYASIAYNQGAIFKALCNNEDFKKQFVVNFMDLMNENFSAEKVIPKLQEYGQDISWMDSFFEKRPKYMKKYIAEEFGLEGIGRVMLRNEKEEAGSICVNSITPTLQNGSWSGDYFTDYPITVTAIPNEGYRFLHWSGSVESMEEKIEVPVTAEGVELIAVFEKE